MCPGWTTDRTGHIGDPLSLRGGSEDAMEGVFGNGRKAAVCGSSASRGANVGVLQGVWDLSQDRLQDLRSLPGVRRSGTDGQKPTSLSLCPSTSLPGGELYSER